jgi:hypothetical protein
LVTSASSAGVGFSVEHDARAGPQVERARIDAGDGRDPQSAREDRDVRRRAPHRRAEGANARTIERRGVRRREILGDHDRVGRNVVRSLLMADQ